MNKLFVIFCLLLIPGATLASVNVMTGNLSYRQELFATQGGALPLQLSLQYNSLDKVSGQVGVGWSHSFEIYLHENSDGTLVLAGGLRKHFYFLDGSGNYVSRASDFSTLTANTDGTYTITFPDGRIYQFGSNKKLSSVTDRYGNSLNFDNAIDGQLTITDSAGRSAMVLYDSDSRVSSIQDPAGSTFNFSYNVDGFLETLTYPTSQGSATQPVWHYYYDEDNLLSYIEDPNGQIHKYEYTDGKVTRAVAPEGVTDTSGGETDDAASYSKTYTYGSTVVPTRLSDVISVATTQTRVVREDGGQWLYFYTPVEGVLVGEQDPLGYLHEYRFYDSNSAFYGQRQTTLTPLDGDGSTVRYRLTSYLSFDENGNPLEITRQVRTISYDDDGLPVEIIDGAIDSHITYTYGSYNRPTSVTDLLAGITTTIAYENLSEGGERVTLTAPKINMSDSSSPQTVLVYRADGQLSGITDPLGRVVTYSYSSNGLLTAITDPDSIIRSFSNFDELGLAQTITLTGTDGTSQITHLEYDTLAQLIQITQGASADVITNVAYDGAGNRIGLQDAEGNQTDYAYDSNGQVTRISQYLGSERLDTQLQYGGSGCSTCSGGTTKLTALTDAKGQTTQFSYDTLGRLTRETDANLKSLSYSYAADGRPVGVYSGASSSGDLLLTYGYTEAGKLASKTSAGGTVLASYSYDNKQRLQSASTPSSTATLAYYDNGWLKSVDNGTYMVSYEYDATGRKDLVTLTQGGTFLHSLDYLYDSNTHRLTGIVSSGAGSFEFGYDGLGRRSSLSYPNNVVAGYTYDNTTQMDWLSGIAYTSGVGGTPLLNVGYPQHDKVGNRLQRSENGSNTHYLYDNLYRVTQAQSGSAAEVFSYDVVGNRISGPAATDSYTHNAGNQMLQGRELSFAYDERGNQSYRYLNSSQTDYWHYRWNAENQLIQAELTEAGATVRTLTFKYDAFGRRVTKQVAQSGMTKTTSYIYDGEDIILQLDNDGSTTTITYYVHGPGIDDPLAMIRGGQPYYYHADGLGSIIAITDSSQAIVQRYGYDTFGQLTANDDFVNNYAFTGREWDKELGLYYYRARYYDPMEGRFISKDPIAIRGNIYNQGVNVTFSQYVSAVATPYLYTENNPLNFIDPTGLVKGDWWDYRTYVSFSTTEITNGRGTVRSLDGSEERAIIDPITMAGISFDIMIGGQPDTCDSIYEGYAGFSKSLSIGAYGINEENSGFDGIAFHIGWGTPVPLGGAKTLPAHTYLYEGLSVPSETYLSKPGSHFSSPSTRFTRDGMMPSH